MDTDSLGVSVGAAHLTAARHPGAVTRWTSVLTIAPHVRPEAGLPEENPRVRADGIRWSDFVQRVGDPVPMTGPGGAERRAEDLVVEAIGSLIAAQAGTVASLPVIVIAVPAYWSDQARSAFAAATAALPGSVQIRSDLETAFVRLRRQPDAPHSGVVCLADLGATGTTIAIWDAGEDQPLAQDRLDEPNGEDLDHQLLRHILAQVMDPADLISPDPNLTAALARVRAGVRAAKERLSAAPVASVPVDLPGFHGDVRITRSEFEDLIGESVDRISAGLSGLLERAGREPSAVSAVALFGGGAAIPLVTQRLSAYFHTAVLPNPEPSLTAALGAADLAAAEAGPPHTTTSPGLRPTVPRPGTPHPVDPHPERRTARSPQTGQHPVRPAAPPPARPLAPSAPHRVHTDPTVSRSTPVHRITYNPADDREQPEKRHPWLVFTLILGGIGMVLAVGIGVLYMLGDTSRGSDAPPLTSSSRTTTPITSTTDDPTVVVVPTWTPPPTTRPNPSKVLPGISSRPPSSGSSKVPASGTGGGSTGSGGTANGTGVAATAQPAVPVPPAVLAPAR